MTIEDIVWLTLGPQGRVVIPAAVRKALGLESGQVLAGHIENDRLILEPRELILRRIQARFAEVVPPGISLADELVSERHDEGRLEAEGE